MFAAAQKHRVNLREAYPYMSQLQTLRLREIIASGELGRIQIVTAAFGFSIASPDGVPTANPQNIRLLPERGGGALYDAGTYATSFARLVMGDLLWDEVTDVVDTGRFEPVYDLSVQSRYAKVENFLAGHGGVLTSNTAGFIDASFEGHVTLEISNLANLPIALYPGMRIGQISFVEMTTPAERPYGPARGSKYSGQQLPTASRLYLDFQQ